MPHSYGSAFFTEYDFGEISFAISKAANTRPIPVNVAVIAKASVAYLQQKIHIIVYILNNYTFTFILQPLFCDHNFVAKILKIS